MYIETIPAALIATKHSQEQKNTNSFHHTHQSCQLATSDLFYSELLYPLGLAFVYDAWLLPASLSRRRHGANKEATTQQRAQTIVKDHIFPKIKFADLDEDLSFSNDPWSLCRQMETLASVTDVDIEEW